MNFSGFPYHGHPVVFPAVKFLLRPAAERDRFSMPTHQFGGMPFLLDPSMEQRSCVVCGGEMELVASIGNQCFSHEEGFFGNDFVQLVYFGCGRCQVLSAVNVAD